jgi:hypothetical protein
VGVCQVGFTGSRAIACWDCHRSGLSITEKGNGGGQKSQSKLSSNANDFPLRLEETGLIEKNTSIPGETTWQAQLITPL